MDKESGSNDSFGSKISQRFKDGTKPKFLGGQSEGGDAPVGLKTDDKKSSAAAGLKSAEESATNANLSQSEDNISGTRESEEQAEGFYSGSGKNETEADGKKKGLRARIIKGGPILAILAAILGVGGIMGGAQMFQPFSLVAQFRETFNSMHTSANLRSAKFFEMQMNTGRYKNPIKGKIFGPNTFKITKNQASKLAAQGIEYDDDFEGSGVRVLKYSDGDVTRVVVADGKSLDAVYGTGAFKEGGEYGLFASTFKDAYYKDSDFFNKYNAGSATWRGAIANWFESVTDNFMKNNNIGRNKFDNFQKKVAEADGNTREAAIEVMSKGTEEVEEGGVKVQTVEEETTQDSDGQQQGTGRYDLGDDAESGSSKFNRTEVKSETDIKSKLQEIGDKYSGGSVTGTIGKVANYACLGLNFLGGVSLLVTATEALQIINLTTGYFEAVDKTKAGLGDETPINDLTNALNERKQNTNAYLTGTNGSESNITENGITSLSFNEQTTDKTAMESSGIASLYSGERVNPNDPSVQSFNFTSSIKRILGGIGVSMTAFESCAFAKIAANAASAIQSGVEIGACVAGIIGAIFTLGISAAAGCSGLIADTLVGIATGVGVGLLITGLISTITPVVAKMLTRDLITNLGGEDLGNALTSGGNMYLGNTHRANGGSLSNREKYIAYRTEQQKVIAENAKYERSTLSPFDATSKYTFMGVLLGRMMGLLSTNTLMKTLVTSGSVMELSISSLSPTTLAYDISKDMPTEEEYESVCPYLASIGAVGDAYCNPYSMTDISTMSDDPVDVIDTLDKNNNFMDTDSSDGNVRIRGDSDLAKYILYCDNRESAFGIADQNIVSQTMEWGDVRTESSTLNNVSNSAIGAVPVVGDIIDVVQNSEALANSGYIGGESCVAGNEVTALASPNWETAKYYQRFIEDQSLAESMGLIEKSAVAVFLDDYYEQNPLDNSYEGILARKTGMAKEDVIALLDIIQYGNYIANYHPEERYAFGAPAVETEENLNLENEYRLAGAPVLLNEIVYADVRNRSFAV